MTVGWILVTILGVLVVLLVAVLVYLWRRLVQTESRLADLDRQPAVISHEIRTPLSLVSGAAELLSEGSPGPLTPVQESFVATIADNTQVVIDMAENMLTAARIDSGGFATTAELVDVRAVVSTSVREVRRILGTPIHLEASGGLLPIVTDENRVRQMVWNLVNNAARHAGSEATVTVSVRGSAEGGCTISVADDGEGMTEEELQTLFVPFATGHGRRPGSGLGMMVVKRIAESLGGRVLVDAEAGLGTAIMVRLPQNLPGED